MNKKKNNNMNCTPSKSVAIREHIQIHANKIFKSVMEIYLGDNSSIDVEYECTNLPVEFVELFNIYSYNMSL